MTPTVDTRPSRKSRLKGPRLSRYLNASAMAGAAAAPMSVLANFSGDYSVTPPPAGVYTNTTGPFGNWTASFSGPGNESLDTTAAPNQISLSADQGFRVGTSMFTFLTTAAATGLVSFNYSATGSGSAFFVEGTTLFPLIGSGPFSEPVTSGDSFGFELTTGYVTDVALTINTFSAPEPGTAVPDNGSTLALLAFGFVGLLALREKVRPAA
jgi:hypothetical protein